MKTFYLMIRYAAYKVSGNPLDFPKLLNPQTYVFNILEDYNNIIILLYGIEHTVIS